jgi:hypothetical protein
MVYQMERQRMRSDSAEPWLVWHHRGARHIPRGIGEFGLEMSSIERPPERRVPREMLSSVRCARPVVHTNFTTRFSLHFRVITQCHE